MAQKESAFRYNKSMNIFVLDESPVVSARYLHNDHVVKMILESTQMLCSAHRVIDGQQEVVYHNYGKLSKSRRVSRWRLPDDREDRLYKATHTNHPCNIWVRENTSNYQWLLTHTVSLIREYKLRYGKVHKSSSLLPLLSTPPRGLPTGNLSSFPLAMPEKYRTDNPVESYRRYYVGEKLYPRGRKASWKNRSTPFWIGESLDNF